MKLNECYQSICVILGKDNMFFIVIANKTDLNDIEVENKEWQDFSKSIDILFFMKYIYWII